MDFLSLHNVNQFHLLLEHLHQFYLLSRQSLVLLPYVAHETLLLLLVLIFAPFIIQLVQFVLVSRVLHPAYFHL